MQSVTELVTSALFEYIPPIIKPLFDRYPYPWQILQDLKSYLTGLVIEGMAGYNLHSEGVLIGDNVKIADGVTILPPAVIERDCELRPGAYIRGSVYIGRGTVIGNSSEIKNSVILSSSQLPHYNYIGDSVLGNHSHMGAAAIASNLKGVGGTVSVTFPSGERVDTGLRKLGAILADGADIGCATVLNPGTVVGKNTSVYPLLALRGTYPANSIVKSVSEIVNKY